jgi:hypothetical protein
MAYILDMTPEQKEQLANAALAEADKLPPYHPQRRLHLQGAFALLEIAEMERARSSRPEHVRERETEFYRALAIDLGLDPEDREVKAEIEKLVQDEIDYAQQADE